MKERRRMPREVGGRWDGGAEGEIGRVKGGGQAAVRKGKAEKVIDDNTKSRLTHSLYTMDYQHTNNTKVFLQPYSALVS